MQLYIRKRSFVNPNRFKYKVNQRFFVHWNSQMAYILGFTFADGNIHHASLAWDLKSDVGLLRKINKAMNSNYPIKRRKNSFRLRISNPFILRDVQKLGIIPNKTKSCLFPNIPEEFFRDFIRGFLDGDGWVIVKRKKMEISIGFSNGSHKFSKELVKKLNELVSLSTNNLVTRKGITKTGKASITYKIEWYSLNAFKIIKLLYDDLKENDLFLERKYKKQLEARKIYEEILKGGKKYRDIEKKYKLPMRTILHNLFIKKDYTRAEIATKLGVHHSSICRWLEKTGVRLSERRTRKIETGRCPVCGKQFKYCAGRYRKYCSERCRLRGKQTGKAIKCAVCGEKTYRPKWWFKVNSIPLCSGKCVKEWRHIRVEENPARRSKKTGRFVSLNSK